MDYKSIADARHPLYEKMHPRWKKCRDSVAGEDEIKDNDETYLPKQGTETTDTQYHSYLARANFLGISRRTVEALTGIAFKELPKTNSDEWGDVEYLMDNVDGAGTSLYEQMKSSTWDVITTARSFLYVDYPKSETGTKAEDDNLQASISRYTTEQVVNWGYEVSNGKKIVTYAVLKEAYNSNDDFTYDIKAQYRLLWLDDSGLLWGVLFDEDGVVIEDEYEIKANGKQLTFIPLFLISAMGETISTEEQPPMLKVANVNLAHYRTDAEMRMCMHYHSMPQPVITGCTQTFIKKHENEPLVIGTDEVMMLEGAATFTLHQVQFNASGYHSELDRLKESAVEIGARLVLNNGSGVESAETVRLKGAGDISVLGSILLSVTQAYELAVNTAGLFMGETVEAEISVAAELIKPIPDGTLLAGLLNAQLRGLVGGKVIFDYLQNTGVIATDVQYDDVKKDIANGITGIPFPDNGADA